MQENQDLQKFDDIRKRAKERSTTSNKYERLAGQDMHNNDIKIIDEDREKENELSKDEQRKLVIFEILDMVLEMSLMFILFLSIYTFVASPFVVSGQSMDNTFQDQEFIIVNRLVYNSFIGNPDRGDVIVFHPPTPTKEYYIKRIIGIPGDTISFKNNNVYLNGKLLNEPYTKCVSQYTANDLNEKYRGLCDYKDKSVEGHSFQVPEGYYFAMGDNRNRSSDSRSCFGMQNDRSCTESSLTHFVPRGNIVGKASFVFWPFSQKSATMKAAGQNPSVTDYIWPFDNLEFVKTYRSS